ncbi:MAG: glycosyltransferase [Thaumarchaeota archaeon]|nr:glycosyltransferase [Nitrososphaerota archaeon]
MTRLLLVTFDPPENIGGIEGRSRHYAVELRRRGHFVETASLSPGYLQVKRVEGDPSIVRLNSSTARLPSSLYTSISMVIKDSLSALLLVSGSITLYGLALSAYCRASGRRVVVFLYGRDVLQARTKMAEKILLLFALRLASVVAVNSRFTESILSRGNKYMVIYPSVDPKIREEATFTRREEDRPRVLFVGRLVLRKGVDLLLKAFKSLQVDMPDIEFDIVGDGPEMPTLKRLAADLSLGGRVKFHGALVGSELYDRFAMADVLVLPARSTGGDVEGFGTVFLEAGVFGMPSVGTRTGGISEAVLDGKTGLLVPEDDAQALEQAIRKLLIDPELRRKLGKKAQERAISEFSIDKAVDKLEMALSPPNGSD